jgi:hypothetical protein
VLTELEEERQGKGEAHHEHDDGTMVELVSWKNSGCRKASECTHTETWEHTVNDGYLAQVCQGKDPNQKKTRLIKHAMRRFLKDQNAWVSVERSDCALIVQGVDLQFAPSISPLMLLCDCRTSCSRAPGSSC